MASNCDVQECTSNVKKRKIKLDSSDTFENNMNMDINLFLDKFCSSSSGILEEVLLPGSRITPISKEQVLTNGDSGFSEIEMAPSTEENTENTRLPSLDTDLESFLPESSSFDSNMEIREEMNDNDDMSSTISDLSGMSDLSGQDWKPTAGPMSWVHHQMASGANPRDLLLQLVQDKAAVAALPPGKDDFTLWKIIISMLSEPPRRKKLPTVNTLEDVINLIKTSKNIIVLTGAGVSVSCGIPDFRSKNGIYSRLAVDFPDLPDPQAMFDIQYFNRDPRPFFKFARDIYPGQFKPSPCHRFIRALEQKGKLLRNYTQNIDTLEQVAGIERVIQCHGSFATASCTRCKRKVQADDIRKCVFAQKIPVCVVCQKKDLPSVRDYRDLVSRGIMKPDITFFGEGLPEDFHEAMAEDKDKCDLLIVIGSSLKVRPVALIPSSIPAAIPQILINLEPLSHLNFDVELLGESDIIIDHICRMLGEDWVDLCWRDTPLTETTELLPEPKETTNTQKSEGEAENVTNQINSLTEIFVGKVSEERCGHTVHEAKNDCNENCRKRSLDDVSAECSGSETKKQKLTDEKTNVITQSLRDVRVGSVDSMVDSGEGESVCSETCGLKDLKQSSPGLIKERQMSMDSTRDSGIGESGRELEGEKNQTSNDEGNVDDIDDEEEEDADDDEDDEDDDDDDDDDDDGTCWQPKQRISVSKRLPENTYFFISPNRYVFQGAEVYSTTSKLKRSEDDSPDSDDTEFRERDLGSPQSPVNT